MERLDESNTRNCKAPLGSVVGAAHFGNTKPKSACLGTSVESFTCTVFIML